MCSGPVPQQPPTSWAPSLIHPRASRTRSSGEITSTKFQFGCAKYPDSGYTPIGPGQRWRPTCRPLLAAASLELAQDANDQPRSLPVFVSTTYARYSGQPTSSVLSHPVAWGGAAPTRSGHAVGLCHQVWHALSPPHHGDADGPSGDRCRQLVLMTPDGMSGHNASQSPDPRGVKSCPFSYWWNSRSSRNTSTTC